MNRFKKGDRVRLVNIIDGPGNTYPNVPSNTIGNTGVIDRVCENESDEDTDALPYRVKWDSGEYNSYRAINLVRISEEEDCSGGCIDE